MMREPCQQHRIQCETNYHSRQ